MANAKGMNALLSDPQIIEQIRNPPAIPIQDFGIFGGSTDPSKDYDIPTTQTGSNGITLYYAPAAAQQHEPVLVRPRNNKKRPRSHSEEPGGAAAAPQEEGHRGLGGLDELPVSPQVILSHGGRGDISTPRFVRFVKGVARRAPVLCFRKDMREGKDSLETRTAAFNYFLADASASVLALGGRSFGSRCATRATVYSANKYLILWSYPLVSGMDVRSQELLALPEDVRVLFIRGSKDEMSPDLIFHSVRHRMKAKSWHIKVKNKDHHFTCKDAHEEEQVCGSLGVIAGIWLKGTTSDPKSPWNTEDGTEMAMHYDADQKKAVWTNWTPLPQEENDAAQASLSRMLGAGDIYLPEVLHVTGGL